MNFEKLEALVSVMTSEQYLKFETAVFELMRENKLFTKSDLVLLEKKVEHKKEFELEKLLAANN